MKIDISDGTILFEHGSILPSLDRKQFLETSLGQTAKESAVHQHWRHYDIDPESGILGTVLFDDDAIDRVSLAMIAEGEDPESWSVERELERKERHERWLRQELGQPPYSYAWGCVVSEFDPKGLASEIIVVYER